METGSAFATTPDPREVLVLFAEALAAPETAWSLLDDGLAVTALTRRGSRPSLRRSRSVQLQEITAPEHDAQRARAELAELLQTHRFTAVMPLEDAAVWLCDQTAALGVPVAGPTGPQAALALDKRRQLEAAAGAGLRVPPTRCVASVSEVLESNDFPIVLKPAHAVYRSDRRVRRATTYVCGNKVELAAAAHAWAGSEPMLMQPLLTGTGEGLFGLAGPDGLFALSAHRRIRMMDPSGSGSSACRSIDPDPELVAGCEQLLLAAGWRGLFMVEFLRDTDGIPWFMEINGRPWGSMALARRGGLEYPAWAVRQLQDPEFTIGSRPRLTGQVCRHAGRELVHLLLVLRGPRSTALDGWPARHEALRDVLRIRRRERWYNWRPSDWLVFFDDIAQTVLLNTPLKARVRQLLLAAVEGGVNAGLWVLSRASVLRRMAGRRVRRAIVTSRQPLFVCHGNLNRSAFAAALARRTWGDCAIFESGYHPVADRPSTPAAIAAARVHGLDLTSHRSTALTADQLERADAIFLFDRANVARVLLLAPQAWRRIHLLGAISRNGPIEIADPEGGPSSSYEETFNRIAECFAEVGRGTVR